MIGILIVAHGALGESLIHCASHVMGSRPPHLQQFGVTIQDDSETVLARAKELLSHLDQGDGVLILSDIYGATPTNITCRLLDPGRVEGIAGVNLPMLIRALTYRDEPLATVVQKALSGGHEGIIYTTMEVCNVATGTRDR